MNRFENRIPPPLVAAAFALAIVATYANSLLFPVVALSRFLKRIGIGGGTDTKPLPAALQWLDPIFRTVLGIEARLIGWNVRLPFGLSAICYAEKVKSTALES